MRVTKLRKPWRSELGSEEERSIAVGVQRVASRGVGCCHFHLLDGESQFGGRPQRSSKSLGAFRRRGLLRWAPATKRWRSQETAHAGALSQGGSARMLLHSMPPAGALTRPSSSDCSSSSRSPSFPRSREIKEEKRIAWFPWPRSTQRSIDS